MRPKKLFPVKKICGDINVPGDKSISHRAIMVGSIATGVTVARGVLDCDDCNYTIGAFRAMGVDVKKDGDTVAIVGAGLRGLKKPIVPINVGVSGTTMRILPGILAGQDFSVTLTGGAGLLCRPMKRVVEPLSVMGVDIKSEVNGCPPLRIHGGRVKSIEYAMTVSSAQVKSAILFAALYADGVSSVIERVKSRDHTERMLSYFGVKVNSDKDRVSINPVKELSAKSFDVPGDISSASFFMAAAILVNGSRVIIRKVSVNPTRAGIIDILRRMGAKIRVFNMIDSFEPYADIEIESGAIKGIEIDEDDIPGIIDELPIIFVLTSLAKGRTIIKGAGELRVKETDRISSMKFNLNNMGAKISVEKDMIIIDGIERLRPSEKLKSYDDHRTCMSMAVAAMTASGESTIDDIGCVSKSFPEFFEILESLIC